MTRLDYDVEWTVSFSSASLGLYGAVWVRYLIDPFSFEISGGNWPLNVKFSKIPSDTFRGGGHRFTCLQQSWRKSAVGKLPECRLVSPATKKPAARESSEPPCCPDWTITSKISWTLRPFTSVCVPNLVRSGCGLPELIPKKIDFFRTKIINNIGWKHAVYGFQPIKQEAQLSQRGRAMLRVCL